MWQIHVICHQNIQLKAFHYRIVFIQVVFTVFCAAKCLVLSLYNESIARGPGAIMTAPQCGPHEMTSVGKSQLNSPVVCFLGRGVGSVCSEGLKTKPAGQTDFPSQRPVTSSAAECIHKQWMKSCFCALSFFSRADYLCINLVLEEKTRHIMSRWKCVNVNVMGGWRAACA